MQHGQMKPTSSGRRAGGRTSYAVDGPLLPARTERADATELSGSVFMRICPQMVPSLIFYARSSKDPKVAPKIPHSLWPE